jgi:biotin operon repressor
MAKENKDEQIGFHKGALTTLAKERQELARLLEIVEQLMQMHVKGLKELGIDLEAEAAKAAKAADTPPPKAKSLEEDIL